LFCDHNRDPIRDPIRGPIRDPIRGPIRDLIHDPVRGPVRDPVRSDPDFDDAGVLGGRVWSGCKPNKQTISST